MNADAPRSPAPTPRRELPRVLGFWGVTAVMMGIIIGSGIFRTPTDIAKEIASPWMILGLWLAGGLISLCGAFTFAELATMFPQSGGVYVFLREGYGRFGRGLAFVFGWTYTLISKPFAAAGIAIIFGENVLRLFGGLTADAGTNTLRAKMVTSAVLVGLTWVNVRGVRLGTGLAGVLTTMKVGALVAIIGLAFSIGSPTHTPFAAVEPALPTVWYLAMVAAMSGILWTYDGWSDVGSLAGEIKDPKRRLPVCYIAGTLIITGIYVGVNAAYFWILPIDAIRGENNLAPRVIETLLGGSAGVLVTALIVVSTLGSTHGSIMTGARITFAQSNDGLLFGVFRRVHPRYMTPHASLWIQLALSLTALWGLDGFTAMAEGFTFTMWIFYGLAGLALFTLRVKRPDAERPYRCWGYPVVPALFVLAAGAMTALSIWGAVKQDGWRAQPLWWLLVLAAGVPIYLVWERLRRRHGVES
jgi:basic amino acid/polyamine antiporter, APA family